jgi:hypothetical protein
LITLFFEVCPGLFQYRVGAADDCAAESWKQLELVLQGKYFEIGERVKGDRKKLD